VTLIDNDEPIYSIERRVELINRRMADTTQDSFYAFRKVVRPDMLLNPFVRRVNRELQRFGEALEVGDRPKLAFVTPAQAVLSSSINWRSWTSMSRCKLRCALAMTRASSTAKK
jgi:hypothetical protein